MTGDRGPQGERGEQGPRGERGLSRPVRRAIIALFAFTLALGVLNLFWTAYLVRQAAHAKCGTVVTLAHLPAPATRFDLAVTAAFAARAAQLGCQERP